MKTAYVIFREDPNTHEEVYFKLIARADSRNVAITDEDVESAAQFDTARLGYEYAAQFSPLLDNWRVGLR